ncbi:MAG: hypothetical protein WB239_15410 [Acidimicrobiia bacterium]
MRRLSLLTLVVLMLAGCATAPSGSRSTTTTPSSTTAVRTAPDFTLQLGDGGQFVLSEETRPVFLVFWAEW